MTQRMPCSITEGVQFEDPIPGLDDLEDEDFAYERTRQESIDNAEQITDAILTEIVNITRKQI